MKLPKIVYSNEVRVGLKIYAWTCFVLTVVMWVLFDIQAPYRSNAIGVLMILMVISGPVPFLLFWKFSSFTVGVEGFLYGVLLFIIGSLVILPFLLLPFVKRRSWLSKLGFCFGSLLWLLSGYYAVINFIGANV